MKRFHVHVQVEDLEQSTRFYATMFGTEPSVQKPDYAKWMLEDPRLNFAISPRRDASGINHLGFQLDSDEELAAMHAQLQAADDALVTQSETTCCYARSNKYWVKDPSGIAWETFHTLGDAPVLKADDAPVFEPKAEAHADTVTKEARACCNPAKVETAACC